MAQFSPRIRNAAWIILSIFALSANFQRSVFALEIIALAGAPNSQGGTPSVTSYPSISNFRSNVSGTTKTRGSGQGPSCDFAITADGTFYYISGDASATGNKQAYSWPSVTAWAANSSITDYGIRSNAEPMAGMAIYLNELYILEGSMSAGGTKTLKKWPSIANWVSGAAGTDLGSRSTNAGIGFDIGLNGVVYFLGTTNDVSPNTATSGTLFTWPTINDFLANTNVSTNSDQFNFSVNGSNQIAGLAVPEPSTYVMATLSGLALAAAQRWRKLRKA